MEAVNVKQSEEKPYELKFEERNKYLYVRVEGRRSVEPSLAAEYLREITSQCRRHDCSKVVIEKHVAGRLGVWDIFSVATRFPLMGSQLTKIAVVDKHLERSQRREFSVMVGRESGLDLHVFTNVADAEHWVLDDSFPDESEWRASAVSRNVNPGNRYRRLQDVNRADARR